MAELQQLAEAAASLLVLPEPCLLAVLQCLADDPASLCSAARAHSRLHQAAVMALSSITAKVSSQKRLYSSLLPYLSKHGQHVSSMQLDGSPTNGTPCWHLLESTIRLSHLAPMAQLSSLCFERVALQLQPGEGFQGVVQAGLPIKQLRLSECWVEHAEGLAAALLLLPGLQHLSICRVYDKDQNYLLFVTEALQQLQQLTYLELDSVWLQRSPGHGQNSTAGSSVLEPLRGLTQLADLRLTGVHDCSIAADTLPGHLTRLVLRDAALEPGGLTGKTLLQHLDLDCCHLPGRTAGSSFFKLEPLRGLTQLADLRLTCTHDCSIAADTLPGHLTRLVLRHAALEPGGLTGKTLLQHLDLDSCYLPGRTTGVAQLLSELQQLTQLTHLNLGDSMQVVEAGRPPAAAFSALTASSKLQCLDISGCALPVDVWDHIFPAGRQLPHLQRFHMMNAWPADHDEDAAALLDGSCLVSCCPGLQSVIIAGWRCSTELVAPLKHLTGLTELSVPIPEGSLQEMLGQICQLTRLRELELGASSIEWKEGLLLQLTQLRQLTDLQCYSEPCGKHLDCFDKAPGDEPVWRQVTTATLPWRSRQPQR